MQKYKKSKKHKNNTLAPAISTKNKTQKYNIKMHLRASYEYFVLLIKLVRMKYDLMTSLFTFCLFQIHLRT